MQDAGTTKKTEKKVEVKPVSRIESLKSQIKDVQDEIGITQRNNDATKKDVGDDGTSTVLTHQGGQVSQEEKNIRELKGKAEGAPADIEKTGIQIASDKFKDISVNYDNINKSFDSSVQFFANSLGVDKDVVEAIRGGNVELLSQYPQEMVQLNEKKLDKAGALARSAMFSTISGVFGSLRGGQGALPTAGATTLGTGLQEISRRQDAVTDMNMRIQSKNAVFASSYYKDKQTWEQNYNAMYTEVEKARNKALGTYLEKSSEKFKVAVEEKGKLLEALAKEKGLNYRQEISSTASVRVAQQGGYNTQNRTEARRKIEEAKLEQTKEERVFEFERTLTNLKNKNLATPKEIIEMLDKSRYYGVDLPTGLYIEQQSDDFLKSKSGYLSGMSAKVTNYANDVFSGSGFGGVIIPAEKRKENYQNFFNSVKAIMVDGGFTPSDSSFRTLARKVTEDEPFKVNYDTTTLNMIATGKNKKIVDELIRNVKIVKGSRITSVTSITAPFDIAIKRAEEQYAETGDPMYGKFIKKIGRQRKMIIRNLNIEGLSEPEGMDIGKVRALNEAIIMSSFKNSAKWIEDPSTIMFGRAEPDVPVPVEAQPVEEE